MLENNIFKLQLLKWTYFNGVLGAYFNRFIHQCIEGFQRSIRFTVKQNKITQVLKRGKYGHRYKLHGNKLSCSEHLPENKP